MSNYLTDQEMASLVEAIQSAEQHSSGEIRIHIDSNTDDHNAEAAFEVFKRLCMSKTAERNAVLFHINFDRRYLTIIGDEGIHQKVHQSFWDRLHDDITQGFSKGIFFEPIKKAVLETGFELKKYFPHRGENINELPDEITFS